MTSYNVEIPISLDPTVYHSFPTHPKYISLLGPQTHQLVPM